MTAGAATATPDTSTAPPNAVTGLTGVERVRGFDLAAGLAVFFMILVHVLWHWGRPETWTTPVGQAISYAAGPTAAPVFVFLMGASLGAARRSRTATLVTRGLWLLFLGYVLNVLRGVIPGSLGTAFGIVTPEQIWPYTPWWLATTVDLHHVVGLSLVAIALLRSRTEPSAAWLGVAGGLVALAPWLRTVQFGTPILDAPLTPILSSAPNVYYAVVPWLAYPLAGAVFGALIARAADRGVLFRRAAAVGIGLLIVGIALIQATRPSFDVFTYWRQPPAFVVAIMGIILVWLALCEAVSRISSIDRRLGVVYGWSDRVIAMYFTHWVIVGWGAGLVGFRALGLGPVLVAMAAAVVLTSYLSRFAVRLEASPWFRRAGSPNAGSPEVAVEVEATAAPGR
jgi:uncharacterized membrane protein